jgi:hypothetical protein
MFRLEEVVEVFLTVYAALDKDRREDFSGGQLLFKPLDDKTA